MSYQQIKEKLSKAYSEKAVEREESKMDEWKVQERDIFLSFLNNSDTLLEIGAGTGKDGLFFKRKGHEVTCIDLSPEMVKICSNKGLAAYEMSFDDLRFSDNSFSAVWAMNCLLHVPKQELVNVLKEIKRVLKPGGHFFWGVYGGHDSEGIWEHDSYEPKRFFSFFSEEKVKLLGGNYFELVSFRTLTSEQINNPDLQFQAMIWKKESF